MVARNLHHSPRTYSMCVLMASSGGLRSCADMLNFAAHSHRNAENRKRRTSTQRLRLWCWRTRNMWCSRARFGCCRATSSMTTTTTTAATTTTTTTTTTPTKVQSRKSSDINRLKEMAATLGDQTIGCVSTCHGSDRTRSIHPSSKSLNPWLSQLGMCQATLVTSYSWIGLRKLHFPFLGLCQRHKLLFVRLSLCMSTNRVSTLRSFIAPFKHQPGFHSS